jgi:hypothetical protein
MTDATPLDTAHAAMLDGDPAAERAYYARLADTEMFLMLDAAPDAANRADDALSPQVFALDEGRFVLAFDREDRLTAFAGRAADYAALSGRALARMLAGQGALGLGVNLGTDAALLLPADGVTWLAEALETPIAEAEARLAEVLRPRGVPEALLRALDQALARTGGLALCAYLASARYEGGGQGHLVAFAGAAPGAEPVLARAVAEALRFSGLEAGALDVVFPGQGAALWRHLDRVALRFDLPEPEPVADPAPPAAPGSDPARPPRLR